MRKHFFVKWAVSAFGQLAFGQLAFGWPGLFAAMQRMKECANNPNCRVVMEFNNQCVAPDVNPFLQRIDAAQKAAREFKTQGDAKLAASAPLVTSSSPDKSSAMSANMSLTNAASQAAIAIFQQCVDEAEKGIDALAEGDSAVLKAPPRSIGAQTATEEQKVQCENSKGALRAQYVSPMNQVLNEIANQCRSDIAGAGGVAVSASSGIGVGTALLGAAVVGGAAYLIGRNNPKSKFKNDGGGGTITDDKDKDKNPGGSGGTDQQQCPDGLVRTPSGTCALPPPTNNPGAGDTTETSSPSEGGFFNADLTPPGGGGLDSGAGNDRGPQGRGLTGSGGGGGGGGSESGSGGTGPLSSGAGGGGSGGGSGAGSGSGGGGLYAMGGGGFGTRGLGFDGGGGGGASDGAGGPGGAIVDQNFIEGPGTPKIKYKGKLITVKECKAIPACAARNRKLIQLRSTDPRLK